MEGMAVVVARKMFLTVVIKTEYIFYRKFICNNVDAINFQTS